MICLTDLLISFWGYALEIVAYILNRVPSKSMPNTTYEIWRGKKLNLKYLKIWDCPTYIKKILDMSVWANKYLFVSYPKESIRYLFYHPTK